MIINTGDLTRNTMGNRKNPKRTPLQIESDRMFCIEHALKGMTYRQIAEALNERNRKEGRGYILSHVQVYRDIQILIGLWQCANKMLIEELVTVTSIKLDLIEREAWEAWDVSKTDSVQEKVRGGRFDPQSGQIVGGETYCVVTKNRCGDPRYLRTIMEASQQRAKLLGLGAETRNRTRYHDPEEDEPLYRYEYDNLSEEMKKIVLEFFQTIKTQQESVPDTPDETSGPKQPV